MPPRPSCTESESDPIFVQRDTETAPLLTAVFEWADKVATRLLAKSELVEAFRYTIKRRDAAVTLPRRCQAGGR